MVDRKTSPPAKGQGTALLVVALLMGGGGLGLGTYMFLTGQGTEESGQVGPVIGIIDPGNSSTVSGIVSVRAMLWSSTPCTYKVLINGWQNATELPWFWDSTKVADGWWNVTVQAIFASGSVVQDQVRVHVINEEVPVYYCSSEAEIEAALDDIAQGAGRIVITQNISVENTVINQRGSYIIEGAAPGVTIDCSLYCAFDIENVASCIIRDLTFDARDFSYDTPVIWCWESGVILEDLTIIGDNYGGWGIALAADNLKISNCYISGMKCGICNWNPSYRVIISGNTIVECNYGINLSTGTNPGDRYTVANNIITGCGYSGINCRATNCTFTGNTIMGTRTSDTGTNCSSIYLGSSAYYNVITGNIAQGAWASDGTGHGIYIAPGATENVVVGNSFLNNEKNEMNLGTATIMGNNNNSP